jgi:hypothetical protein
MDMDAATFEKIKSNIEHLLDKADIVPDTAYYKAEFYTTPDIKEQFPWTIMIYAELKTGGEAHIVHIIYNCSCNTPAHKHCICVSIPDADDVHHAPISETDEYPQSWLFMIQNFLIGKGIRYHGSHFSAE